MKPRKQVVEPQDDLFNVLLADLINRTHPVCRPAGQIDWEMLDAEIAPNFSGDRAFGLPVRLLGGLMCLQHPDSASDERVVERRLENPYWQYLCGKTFLQYASLCDRSSLTHWRRSPADAPMSDAQHQVISNARRLLEQAQTSKNKLYSMHAREVECVSKGKARKRYEFRVKVSFVTRLKEYFVIGARSIAGNPYDGGHTLASQLEQVSILCDQPPEEAYVGRGYRGHGHAGNTQVFIAGQKSGISAWQKTRLTRRNTIEPIIGHMRQDGKLGRCHYQGSAGDAVSAILAVVSENIRKLLKWIIFFRFLDIFRWFRGVKSDGNVPRQRIRPAKALNVCFAKEKRWRYSRVTKLLIPHVAQCSHILL